MSAFGTKQTFTKVWVYLVFSNILSMGKINMWGALVSSVYEGDINANAPVGD